MLSARQTTLRARKRTVEACIIEWAIKALVSLAHMRDRLVRTFIASYVSGLFEAYNTEIKRY